MQGIRCEREVRWRHSFVLVYAASSLALTHRPPYSKRPECLVQACGAFIVLHASRVHLHYQELIIAAKSQRLTTAMFSESFAPRLLSADNLKITQLVARSGETCESCQVMWFPFLSRAGGVESADPRSQDFKISKSGGVHSLLYIQHELRRVLISSKTAKFG
jgi:hypothetical protein